MGNICLNCGTVVTDKFCGRCGQKAEVGRLSWHSLGEEFLHFFTHIEHGFLKTTGQLITRPGKLFKNYLDGKRKAYHKPVSFLLIWITLFLLIYNLALSVTKHQIVTTGALFTYDAEATAIMNKYRSLIEIMILPFIALTGWIIIGRPKLNYVEILTSSFYTISFLFILLCFQLLISLALNLNFRTDFFDISTTAIYASWAFYAAYDFYKKYYIKYLLVRLIAAVAINLVIYFMMVKLIIKLMRQLHIA